MAAFAGFEKTPRGGSPCTLLDTHPDGTYVALRTIYNESAIWEQESKRLVWAPSYAIALSWLKQGTQIAGLLEPEDSSFEFTLFSWPEKQVLQMCPVVFPEGWGHYFDFWVSPQEKFALCRWWDQTEFGFEWLDITPQAIEQDNAAGFFFEGTNNVSRPVFSPNGRLWACGYMNDLWWADDLEEDPNPEQPARGGEYSIGALLIFEGKKRPPRSIPLVATFPSGWLPKELGEDAFMILIADPVFLDNHRIQIQLPSGEVQVHLI